MKLEEINCEITGPLTICCIALFMGMMCFISFKINIIIGVVYSTSYFLIVFLSQSKTSWILMIIVSIIGYVFVLFYFTQGLPGKGPIVAKIVSKNPKSYYGVCSYKGKLINLSGIGEEVMVGSNVCIHGTFTEKPQYEYGTVGEIKCSKIESEKVNNSYNIYNLKDKIYNEFKISIGEESAGVMMSLAYGDTRFIEDTYKEQLSELGIVHIISVSGLHMNILFSALALIPSIALQCTMGYLYVILTGSRPSTMRAFIMIATSKIGRKIYKNYRSINALSLSAIIILCIKPWCAFNLGFILSYSSVLGIIVFYRILQRKLYFLPKRINESVSLSLASMSMTFIILSIMNKSINIGFLVSNMILVPLYSFLTLLGLIFMVVFNTSYLNGIISCVIRAVFALTDGVKNFLHHIFSLEIYFSYWEIVIIICMVYVYLKCKDDKIKLVRATGICLCFLGFMRIM